MSVFTVFYPHPNLPPHGGKEPIPSPLMGRARVGVKALVK
jgi:hypothetical protein